MEPLHVLGMMSGTSLDGLDLAHCRFWQVDGQWQFDLGPTVTIPYAPDFREQLEKAITLPAVELLEFHNQYGTWLGQQAREFIDRHQLRVDFISSHGHTVHHRPEKGLTFQLGSGQHLANASKLKTVCDFRTNDVALGGQGAPLVPIGDRLLFSQYQVCLNLGGIANISTEHQGERIAFDTGMANMPLNHLAQQLGKTYDRDGQLARSGTLDQSLLDALNSLAYYKLPYPKSTGYEWFREVVLPILKNASCSTEDKMHTVVVHNSQEIAKAIQPFSQPKASLLVTGGGALNGFFMEELQRALGDSWALQLPPRTLIDFKEALVFAFMGILRIQKRTNVLASVTGAQRDSCSGVVFLPQ